MDSDVDELRVSEQDADPLDLLALEWRGSGAHKCALIVCVICLHRVEQYNKAPGIKHYRHLE